MPLFAQRKYVEEKRYKFELLGRGFLVFFFYFKKEY